MSTTQRVDSGRRLATSASDIFDRQPPCNMEAEYGVLCSILLLPDVCDDVVTIVRASDFYDEANRTLFGHMVEIHESGKKIDPVLLIDKLKAAGDFERVGGAAYLHRVGEAVGTPANAAYYAEIVRNKSTYRQLIHSCTEILRDAYEESHSAVEAVSRAEQKVFEILDRRSSQTVKDIHEILIDAMGRIDARMKGEHTQGGVDSGFTELDGLLGGLHNSELIILAARPSMGKTALAMNIAEYVAFKLKEPVLFCSLEMSSIELADRLLCSAARVNGHRLRNGSISQEDRRHLVEKASELSGAPLYVDDAPGRMVTEIAAAARRIKRQEKKLGLIVVDYLQLIEPDNPKDPRQEQVARIARRLKGLARELEVPLLCLAQLNRQAEASKDNRPKLSHLRESGAIEQDADVVMFVHRESYYQRADERDAETDRDAEIIIAKQRNGPTGDIHLVWLREFTRFEDKAPDRYQEFDNYNSAGSGGAPAGGEF